jgi:hypothetical protein
MDRGTHRRILAEMYECEESELLSKFDTMTAQIRNDVIITLSIDKRVTRKADVPVYA